MDGNKTQDARVSLAKDYLALGWWLVPVRGPGSDEPKAPVYRGYYDYRPDLPSLTDILTRRTNAGIAVYLGGSGLVDVEADTAEGEAILDDRCRDIRFPCYRSQKGKHRLFLNSPEIEHLAIAAHKIEFRAGRHVSILPPSVHESGELRYEWLVTPFEVPPPPLPIPLLDLYTAHARRPQRRNPGQPKAKKKESSPFRDNLDYVLRNLNLLEIASVAGVEFLGRNPDANGNIPCYVPAVLRDGNVDDHPSGVFNVCNGVLRDFGTGRNHRFFDMIATLTGRDWFSVFKEYESRAGRQTGRPHSRRICLQGSSPEAQEQIDLAEARRQLQAYIHGQLVRPPVPKRLHIITGPPGLGKTTIVCQEMANLKTPAIMLTLENRLATIHADLINSDQGLARRMPILRESGCPYPDEYEAMSRMGYQASHAQPCRTCEIGPRRCRYLIGFSGLDQGAQLCCAAVYHTHRDFYKSYGNDQRKVVVFDENCLDLLLSPVAHPLVAWTAWAKLLRRYRATDDLVTEHVERLLALADWLEGRAGEFREGQETCQAYVVPAEIKHQGLTKLPEIEDWLHQIASKPARQRAPNLYGLALYLLTEPDSHVLLQRVGKGGKIMVRFRKRNPLPEDKEVFILDATANEDLLRAVAVGWDVQIWSCPRIEQQGAVIQIMDYDTSRNFIKKEVQRHREHLPCWTAQVIDAILEQNESAAVISFKKVVTDRRPGFDILGLLRNGHKIKERHHFPCRGISVSSEVLIVLGTPYKDDVTVRELALAIYGMDGCPEGDYRRRYRQEDCFVTGNMGYGDPRLDAIEEFLVSSDLGQAVGRIRPLQSQVKAYVLSNARIPDWEVTQVCASELFDLRRLLRADAADNYDRYVAEAMRRLRAGKSVTNSAVCNATGIKLRSGRTYLSRFKEDYSAQLLVRGRKLTRRN